MLNIINDLFYFWDWRWYRRVTVHNSCQYDLCAIWCNTKTREVKFVFPGKWKHRCHPILSQTASIILLTNQSKQLCRCHVIPFLWNRSCFQCAKWRIKQHGGVNLRPGYKYWEWISPQHVLLFNRILESMWFYSDITHHGIYACLCCRLYHSSE